MGNKAASGTGSTRLRKNGHWEYRFTATDADGVKKQWSAYGKTQKEAISKGKKLEEQYTKGLVARKDGRTFGDFADEWLQRKTRTGKAKTTLDSLTRNLKYIKPRLGPMKLQAVKPVHVRKLLDDLSAKDYSPRTQHHVLQTVKAIFTQAMRLELVYKNPAEFVQVDAPPTKPKGRSLQPEEVLSLLAALPDSPMGLLLRLLLSCGVRKGEALGLRWSDIDLERGELSISKNWTGTGRGHMSDNPKTRSSRRVVPIPSGLLERFKAHYQKQRKDWTARELTGFFVFGTPGEDHPFEVNAPNHALKRITDRINLEREEEEKKTGVEQPRMPYVRVHDLRHSFGSLALSKGIPLEVVSERMGHSTPTITLDIYRHVLEHERQGNVFDVEELVMPRAKAQA